MFGWRYSNFRFGRVAKKQVAPATAEELDPYIPMVNVVEEEVEAGEAEIVAQFRKAQE